MTTLLTGLASDFLTRLRQHAFSDVVTPAYIADHAPRRSYPPVAG